MIRWHSLDEKSRLRAVWRDTPEFVGCRVPLLDAPPDERCSPNAKIIEQRPSSAVKPHFHTCHQFQLITAGSGTLGRHQVSPLTIHYTSPETGYGPIEAGEAGLSYYVLRPRRDPGAKFLPQSRGDLSRGLARHHALSAAMAARSKDMLNGLAAAVVDVCLEPTPEGMAAWKVGLPPEGDFDASALPGSGARFYFVAAGQLAHEGRMLAAGSVCFAEFEDAMQLRAAEGGADVLVMQFPPEATRAEGPSLPSRP